MQYFRWLNRKDNRQTNVLSYKTLQECETAQTSQFDSLEKKVEQVKESLKQVLKSIFEKLENVGGKKVRKKLEKS